MRRWLSKPGLAVEQALSAYPRLRLLAWAGGGVTLMNDSQGHVAGDSLMYRAKQAGGGALVGDFLA